MENNNNNTYIAEIISKIWPADPKYGTDMKDKHVVMRMQKFKIIVMTLLLTDKYERLAISESTESSDSSDSNDASNSEKYSNQSENESTLGFMNLNDIEEIYVNDIYSE
nr:2298_t:CDS:2 [Entrophospora candida]